MMEPDSPNPYAAPETRDVPPEAGTPFLAPGPYGPFRDNRVLARWLVGFLVLGLFVQFARIAVNFIYLSTEWLHDEELSGPIEAIFEGTRLTAIACMILFGVWIVRSGKNAWLLAGFNRSTWRAGVLTAPKLLEDTPGWAVGWYFIPIANLWKPYVAMRDIVRASTLEVGLSGWLLPTWWTLWIVSQITDRVTKKLANVAAGWEPVEQFVFWTSASGIDIALHTVAILLVLGLTRLQSDTAAACAEGTPAAAPDLSEPGPPEPA